MLFFKRILKLSSDAPEQRRTCRYAVGPKFPLQSVLNLVGRDDTGSLLESTEGWDWKGKLVDFSDTGVSIQLPLAASALRGDGCCLILRLDNFQLRVPGHVAHVRKLDDSFLYGVKLDFARAQNPQAYRQLLELVALGASLKPEKTKGIKTDASGLVVENYSGDHASRLTVWRGAASRAMDWFEFQMNGCCVRGDARTRALEFAAGRQVKALKPVTGPQSEEIYRLFRWVVPNIARVVPIDVRNSLQQFAA
jgi:PilZ domain